MIQPSYSETIPTKPGYYVYLLWADDETCLYVGRVGDNGPRPPQPRLNYHRKKKAWWPDVARIEVAELPGHPAVVTEEDRQIKALRPLHNIRRGSCAHDLSLPGAVRLSSGECRECCREYDKNRMADAETGPARKARKAENERKHVRPSGAARRAKAKRLPSAGQGSLWG